MPLKKENGKLVEYEENSRQARRSRGEPRKQQDESPRERRVRQRAQELMLTNNAANPLVPGPLGRMVNQGVMMNFADELSGGIRGAMAAATGGNFSEEYAIERDAHRLLDQRTREEHPVGSLTAELSGAVVNPIGRTGTAAKVANATRVGRAVGASRVGSRLAASPVAQAARAGATQGALNAAGAAESIGDVPGAMALGGTVGGVLGGAAGGLAQGVRRGVQVLADRSDDAAERVAYAKINQRLQNGDMTPEQAMDEIAARNSAGNDMRTMDLTPGTTADAAYYSRLPNNRGSNLLQRTGQQRMADRGNRLRDEIEGGGYSSQLGTEADELVDDIVRGRRATGQSDYAEGGAMDTPLRWTDDMDEFFRNAPNETNQALRNAYDEMLLRRENPAVAVPLERLVNGAPGIGTNTAVPTLRTLDYMKRGFDTEIGKAMKAGDRAKAAAINGELQRLKAMVGEQNPEYGAILSRQRTQFEREEAVSLGEKLLALEPRKSLKRIAGLAEHQAEEARTGILSYLVSLRGNALSKVQGMLNHSRQREVLRFALGGDDNLAKFTDFVEAEAKSAAADAATAGRQSITSSVNLAQEADEGGDLAELAGRGLQGFAFGGVPGTASGINRVLQRLRNTMSQSAQEAYSRILAGTGEDLPAGVELARAYQTARSRSNMRAARTAGKLVQQPFSTQAGD